MKKYKEEKTESISIRLDAELKREFFELMENEDKTFSKWLRNEMIKKLEEKAVKNDTNRKCKKDHWTSNRNKR